jgi:hypothetical protein
MTYQEIKDRLSKCESTLEKFKNGVNIDNKEAHAKINKLTILKESLTKKLAEAQSKTYLVTPKKGQTTAVAMSDDETDALKDADDVKAIKGIDGEEIKEQEGLKFSIDETKSIAKRVGKAVAQSLKSLGDEVAHMKAKSIEENSFEIYVQYKNDADDEFSFYIVDDSLHLTDFSFDKELTDVGVKPSGEAIVNVDVLANELTKHFKSVNEKVDEKDKPELKKLSKALTNSVKAHQDQKKALDKAINTEGEVSEAPEGMYYIKIPKDAASQNKAQVIFNDLHGINYELNDDPDGIFMYFKKEDFDAGVIDDLEGDGVHILDTNIPNVNEDAEEDAKNDADYEAGWHDDPRKDEGDDDFISKIRSAVQGPEVDAIFAAAQKEIDNGDAESMADALAIAADQYYEYYDSKGNEDGTEVAKYIMRSLPQSKSNVQDFSKLKDGDYKNWTVDEKMTGDDDLFTFGFDLDKIQHVIDHLKDNYSDQDYELHVGRGDTHPNAVTLNNPDMENDKELGNLLIAAEDQEETDYQVNRQMQEDEEEDAKNDADYEAGWHDDPRKDEGDETDDYGRPHVDPKGSRTYMDPEEMKPSNRFKKMTQKEDTDIGHQDDEPSMLSATARETAEYSAKLLKKLQAYDQHDGEVDFPNWWQSKLILAREYMSAAFHYLDSEEKQPALDQLALENKVNEGRGDLDQIVRVITDMANEDGTSTKEAALEIIDAIKDAYQIHEGEDTKVLKEYASRDFDEIFGALGYRQGFDEFIEDNPGAVEVLMDWIGSISEFRKKIGAEYSKEEQENLGFYYGDDDEDVYEEAELPKKFNSGKYSVDKLQKAHDVITGVMKDLAKKYKAGDKSVVSQLKDLTKQKKHVESLLDAKVSGTGKDQELDEAGPGFAHDCAAKVVHETYGKGKCIPEKHTLVKEGKKYVVTHYDVLFENGKTVENIPVQELDIKTTNEHWHKGYKKKKK